MAQVELIMPKMGESIMEATILKWLKNIGDTIEMDESVLEIATDKVDSEVPSPVAGVLKEILFQEGDTVDVGKAIAVIAVEGEETQSTPTPTVESSPAPKEVEMVAAVESVTQKLVQTAAPAAVSNGANGSRFYSPLVLNIARTEQISMTELENIPGSGKDNRVTKKDMLNYINVRTSQPQVQAATVAPPAPSVAKSTPSAAPVMPSISVSGNVEIVEMDRMRRLIADHMVMSKKTSPHVTSFVEVDVTNMVNWRNSIKEGFQKQHGQKITFTPIFVEAVVKGIRDFPGVNASVDGYNVVLKKDVNIGIATALPATNNLIVPVVKGADLLNLTGLTKSINGLIQKARTNKLRPDDTQGGTFTLTNVGTFGNTMGTPIINQPQVAILATGAIKKKPAVIETEHGDVIGIRHMMFLSLSYDHRIVDGFMGGSFLRKVADYLEAFDPKRTL